MNIEELKKQSHEIAVEKGFWKDYEIANNLTDEREKQVMKDLFISQKLLLMISELTESMESLRNSRTYQGDKNLIKDEEIKIAVQVNGKVRAEIMIKAEDNEEEIKKQAASNEIVLRHMEGKEVKKVIYVKNRLINIVI